MLASYRVVPYLQCCYGWVVTSSAVHNYWKCDINVVAWMCSGFYLYIRTLPWALRALRSRAYISVKPLTAVLQYVDVCMHVCVYGHINACIHACMYACIYVHSYVMCVCMNVCVYICIYVTVCMYICIKFLYANPICFHNAASGWFWFSASY